MNRKTDYSHLLLESSCIEEYYQKKKYAKLSWYPGEADRCSVMMAAAVPA